MCQVFWDRTRGKSVRRARQRVSCDEPATRRACIRHLCLRRVIVGIATLDFRSSGSRRDSLNQISVRFRCPTRRSVRYRRALPNHDLGHRILSLGSTYTAADQASRTRHRRLALSGLHTFTLLGCASDRPTCRCLHWSSPHRNPASIVEG